MLITRKAYTFLAVTIFSSILGCASSVSEYDSGRNRLYEQDTSQTEQANGQEQQQEIAICMRVCLEQYQTVLTEAHKLAEGYDDVTQLRIITNDIKNKGFYEGQYTCDECKRDSKFFMRDINNER
jgi:hypothetical protein